jgi:hypothetical protein
VGEREDGTFKVNADPLYVDQVNGNLRLRSGSPAINAGTASYTHLGQPVLAYPPGSYAGQRPIWAPMRPRLRRDARSGGGPARGMQGAQPKAKGEMTSCPTSGR